jgi:hypothetical protein
VDKTTIGFYITIISSLVTIVGFIITIMQIIKTKNISNAAYTAASEAKAAITNTIIISNLSTRVKSVQEIQNDILHEKNDVALLRTKDLIHALIEIRQLILSKERAENDVITEMVVQLSVLRRQLEAVIYKNEKFDVLKANQKLSEFEVRLSELSVKVKFPLQGENK